MSSPQVLYILYPPFSLPNTVWPWSLNSQNSGGMRQPVLIPFISWQNLWLLARYIHFLISYFEIFFDVKSRKNNAESSQILFTQLPLILMYYITQNNDKSQEVNIHTIPLTRLQTLFEFCFFW